MKETLLQLSKYNIWANKKLIDILLKQKEEILDMEITSSFNSLRKTVYHVWGAEDIWLKRLLLAENPVWLPDTFTGSFNEACAQWQGCSKEIQAFIAKQFDDKAFEHVFQYYRQQQSNKEQVYITLLHVFNHATYHRGQLVTMLRQAGVTKIPGTDMALFSKK